MGARPLAAFLSLGLPRELTQASDRQPAWIQRFLDGFLALAAAHNTPLAGGDLAESPLAVADIVLVGAVPRGRALLRSGARPGDLLYVTGSLGAAAAGLLKLGQLAAAAKNHSRPPAIPQKLLPMLSGHLYPQPRIAQGRWLQRHGHTSAAGRATPTSVVTAALDLSDGLSTDLAHLCAESGMAAEVNAAALPIAPGATLLQALHGGEDYELLFTASPASRLPRTIAGVPITPIGRIVRARRSQPLITLMTPRGPQPLEPRGWEHFL
jgi:thiamine-monophosphate kinase